MKKISLYVLTFMLMFSLVLATNNTVNITEPLEFEGLEYTIRTHSDGTKDGRLSDSRRLFVNEGFEVTIDGYVRNLFDDITLSRASVYLESRRMDKLDMRESLRDIDPGYDEYFRFSFTIPYDDYKHRDRFEVRLYVEAEDRYSYKMYRTEIRFDLEIDKNNEEVKIMSVSLDGDSYTCEDIANLNVVIKNIGRNDLTDKNYAALQIRNTELNLNEIISPIEMSAHPYDFNNKQIFNIPINISELKASQSTKNFEVTVYHNKNKLSDRSYAFFKVNECIVPPTTTTTTTTIAPTTTTLIQRVHPDAYIIPSYEPLNNEHDEKTELINLVVVFVIAVLITGVLFLIILNLIGDKKSNK
jgi:hypothetical protein